VRPKETAGCVCTSCNWDKSRVVPEVEKRMLTGRAKRRITIARYWNLVGAVALPIGSGGRGKQALWDSLGPELGSILNTPPRRWLPPIEGHHRNHGAGRHGIKDESSREVHRQVPGRIFYVKSVWVFMYCRRGKKGTGVENPVTGFGTRLPGNIGCRFIE